MTTSEHVPYTASRGLVLVEDYSGKVIELLYDVLRSRAVPFINLFILVIIPLLLRFRCDELVSASHVSQAHGKLG
jgi:hypothetical protein